MQVEDIWDETERVWPLFQGMKDHSPASIFEQPCASEADGAEEKDDHGMGEDSDAPLHFNLSDPDQIRQYCKRLLSRFDIYDLCCSWTSEYRFLSVVRFYDIEYAWDVSQVAGSGATHSAKIIEFIWATYF